jgi:hypothetical protein
VPPIPTKPDLRDIGGSGSSGASTSGNPQRALPTDINIPSQPLDQIESLVTKIDGNLGQVVRSVREIVAPAG